MNFLSRLCPSLTLTIIIFHPHRWPILDERRSTKDFNIFFQHDMHQWVEVIYFSNWNFFPMRLTFFLKISRNFQLFAYILECEAQNNLRCKIKQLTSQFFENGTVVWAIVYLEFRLKIRWLCPLCFLLSRISIPNLIYNSLIYYDHVVPTSYLSNRCGWVVSDFESEAKTK